MCEIEGGARQQIGNEGRVQAEAEGTKEEAEVEATEDMCRAEDGTNEEQGRDRTEQQHHNNR